MDCPNCEAWNLEGTVECECGYVFVGYQEKEDEAELALRARRRTRRQIGLGMIGVGVVLTGASLFLSAELGGGSFVVFSGLIVAGIALLVKNQ